MTPRHFLVCPHVMISALNYIPATHNNVHLIKVSAQASCRKKGVDTLHILTTKMVSQNSAAHNWLKVGFLSKKEIFTKPTLFEFMTPKSP